MDLFDQFMTAYRIVRHLRGGEGLNLELKDLHPAITYMLRAGLRPADWHLLLLQWPHVSSDGRLAYTQSEEKRARNLVTVTSLGKYLKRHWPTVPDDFIRDVVSRHTASFHLTFELDDMIEITKRGPYSCMRSKEKDDHHPYEAYDPSLGWGLAYGLKGDEVWSRALVNTDGNVFVRSFYGSPDAGEHQGLCEGLELWLKEQGYSQRSGWDGYELAKVKADGYWCAPYLDGDATEVNDSGDTWTIQEEGEGEYEFQDSDGFIHPRDLEPIERCYCERCESSVDDDDLRTVYTDPDRGDYAQWCDHCVGRYATDVVVGRNRGFQETCLVSDSCLDDTWVYNDERYSDAGLAAYDLIIAEDGEVYPEDECVESDGEWYHESHSDVHRFEGELFHEDDGWQCEQSGEWYPNSEEAEEFEFEGDDVQVHPTHMSDWIDAHGFTPEGWVAPEVVAQQVPLAIPEPTLGIVAVTPWPAPKSEQPAAVPWACVPVQRNSRVTIPGGTWAGNWGTWTRLDPAIATEVATSALLAEDVKLERFRCYCVTANGAHLYEVDVSASSLRDVGYLKHLVEEAWAAEFVGPPKPPARWAVEGTPNLVSMDLAQLEERVAAAVIYPEMVGAGLNTGRLTTQQAFITEVLGEPYAKN